MEFEFSPKQALAAMIVVIGLLFLANLAGIVSTYVFDHGSLFGLVGLFRLNSEKNIPTLYSSLQLITASGLLYCIARKLKSLNRNYWPWFILATIFVFLAIDETAEIHERLPVLFIDRSQQSGLLNFPWVVSYGTAALLIGIAYLRFLFQLPRHIASLFVASGTVYVVGAIGLEMLGGRHSEIHGQQNLAYALFYSCEELLEMLGIALFIYALLVFICSEYRSFRCTIRSITR
jgi:hypothetical protein